MNVTATRTATGYALTLADGTVREWNGKRALAAQYVAMMNESEHFHASSTTEAGARKGFRGVYGYASEIVLEIANEAPATPAAPAGRPSKTYTVSEYRKDDVLQDTEYVFSDGVTIKDYEPGVITRNRSIKSRSSENDDYRRSSKDILAARLLKFAKVGDTELLEFNTPDAPVPTGTIVLDADTFHALTSGTITARDSIYALNMAAHEGKTVTQGHADYCANHGHAETWIDTVETGFCPRCGERHEGDTARARSGDTTPPGIPKLDPEVQVLDDPEVQFLDSVEIPADPKPAEPRRVTFETTILEEDEESVTARIVSTGTRPSERDARRLIVDAILDRLHRGGASRADLLEEGAKYVRESVMVEDLEDPADMVRGSSDRTYRLERQ